ncbi:sensor histidine kinase [Aquimarina spongiae]|uniref:Histidine kinase n=1 Tax=Aquimarina spongiae TaxID=570521 RepID=A0A1M6HD08_9FLAO|nr:histidine kinase [Aquimarina spongiae]SHJ20044.1 Histidine kinase [Aquimarina spongiae]
MLRIFRKYTTFIAVALLIAELFGMLHFKRMEELSGLEIHDNYFYLFQYLFIFTFGYLVLRWLFRLWKEYRSLKNDKNEAELMLLKSRVDPHFFFNTLNNLYGLAIEKSDRAPEVILKLSEVMRYTIYEGENDYVTLKNEIEYLETYLEIHKLRYQKKVRISFKIQIDDIEIKIAPLMLIMLLENAIKHGVESMVDNAYIDMDLKATKNTVFFQIINNFKPVIRGAKGIGLSNLKKRLQLIYPKRHELLLKKGEGTYQATLKIQTL